MSSCDVCGQEKAIIACAIENLRPGRVCYACFALLVEQINLRKPKFLYVWFPFSE